MKQVFVKEGTAIVEEVPAPLVEAGRIHVQTCFSCISAGTEMSSIRNTGKPLWKRAIENPDELKKVIKMASDLGFDKTKSLIQSKLSGGNIVGYSLAGVIRDVGEGITEFKKGDRVACAGTGYACHAEYVNVPANLVVKIPEGVDFQEAAPVALGAIALQGIRRAQPTLGESFVVIGLGILGQIASQFLAFNGCKVIGIDIDTRRGETALNLGLTHFVNSHGDDPVAHVLRLTDGIGADGCIITAATRSSEVVSQAFALCRKKGRVVLVGDVGLDLKRSDFYTKEIDFFISSSYGPGRYDSQYEEEGHDYPLGYIRWSENRNMSCYLEMIATKKISIKPLINQVTDINDAAQAYESLKSSDPKPLIVLLKYEVNENSEETRKIESKSFSKILRNSDAPIRIGIIGAGGFAKGVHLPNLKNLSNRFCISAIASKNGANAKNIATMYNARYCTSDYREILADKEIDAVIIATRHNLHAAITLDALEQKKHVLVEKPLAITRDDLEKINAFFGKDANREEILLTGFNRRFSPYMRDIMNEIAGRTNPVIINYRMNAGYLANTHWTHSPEGGGRNIGEACHIYQLFSFLVNAPVLNVTAHAIKPRTDYYYKNDNFVMSATFEDGSVATLTYTALGSRNYPKESMEIYTEGKVIRLIDYKSMDITGNKRKTWKTRTTEKGSKEELIAFANAIQNGGEWPIPLWQQAQAMEIAFEVEEFLQIT